MSRTVTAESEGKKEGRRSVLCLRNGLRRQMWTGDIAEEPHCVASPGTM